MRVDQGKPAEGDDAEQQLRRLARRRVVETELRADRGQRLLPGGEMVHPRRWWGVAQRLALDQPDEVGTRRQEVEVVGHRARQNGLRVLIARQGALAADPHRLPYLGQRAVQDRPIELGFAAEEVARSAPRNPRGPAHLGETGGIEALFGEQALRSVEDGSSASVGVSDAVRLGLQLSLVQEVAACLLLSKLAT